MQYHSWTTDHTDAWRDLSNSILPMDHRFRNPGRWRAELTVQESGGYRLMRWDQRGDRIAARTPSHVRRVPGDEHYWIVMPRQGVYTVRHGQDETRTPPGYASAMGMDESCWLSVPESEAYAFQVPRSELDNHVDSPAPLRLVLDLNTGLGRILSALIESTHVERDNLSDHEFHAVCDRMTELFCMIVLKDARPPEAHLTDVARLVREYVRNHLGTGKLPLAAAAHALGWSPRHLRNALHQTGTTYRDLRIEETLRDARDVLQDPAHSDLSISDIASRAGLTPTWFSSAFKSRYGETPRDFRRRRLTEIPAQSEPGGIRDVECDDRRPRQAPRPPQPRLIGPDRRA
ncbi:AraC-like DNA-binding protein [Actinomadura luteofluorescens]|uniref:AraC-like DNA-binding protein n=1 Tax=Actinomadura luteofluorescens TaxID=46163 RepID=A0A7Y9EI01_9ACTN|nr:AraC family transcriptional regulator [Actinomadura luteofluorescens]NYD48047.1 AraC-like DNA-binding protein [Actinomadura luteofluorescens]